MVGLWEKMGRCSLFFMQAKELGRFKNKMRTEALGWVHALNERINTGLSVLLEINDHFANLEKMPTRSL
jgi:hypothetical protein